MTEPSREAQTSEAEEKPVEFARVALSVPQERLGEFLDQANGFGAQVLAVVEAQPTEFDFSPGIRAIAQAEGGELSDQEEAVILGLEKRGVKTLRDAIALGADYSCNKGEYDEDQEDQEVRAYIVDLVQRHGGVLQDGPASLSVLAKIYDSAEEVPAAIFADGRFWWHFTHALRAKNVGDLLKEAIGENDEKAAFNLGRSLASPDLLFSRELTATKLLEAVRGFTRDFQQIKEADQAS